MPDRDQDRRWLYIAAAVVALIALVVASIFIFGDDDSETVAGPDATTSTSELDDTTTTTTTSTTEATTTTSTPAVVDTSTAVFPFADGEQRFDDPVEAAEFYAEGYLGFVEPVYSEFRQGDARSGEIVVQPAEDGPETTILLRQLDETWWILGTVAENIEVDEPEALAVLTSPVALSGRALAFEGAVNVELWTDGADEPLAMTTVTGGGDELAPFEGTLTFDQRPQTRSGALILRTHSAESGAVWEASVLRVHF